MRSHFKWNVVDDPKWILSSDNYICTSCVAILICVIARWSLNTFWHFWGLIVARNYNEKEFWVFNLLHAKYIMSNIFSTSGKWWHRQSHCRNNRTKNCHLGKSAFSRSNIYGNGWYDCHWANKNLFTGCHHNSTCCLLHIQRPIPNTLECVSIFSILPVWQ